MTWTRPILGSTLALAVACQLSVGDAPIDPELGQAGTAGLAGAGGSAGNGGSAGSSADGASAGDAGAAGTGGTSEADAGAVDSGLLPTPPTCSVESSDATDECVQCLKRECCTAWQGCNDRNCQTEREDLAQCVSLLEVQDSEGYGECLSTSSASMDGFLQLNTGALMDCVNQVVPPGDGGIETTRCGTACFGGDIFFDQ
jgi:hypothetical protein